MNPGWLVLLWRYGPTTAYLVVQCLKLVASIREHSTIKADLYQRLCREALEDAATPRHFRPHSLRSLKRVMREECSRHNTRKNPTLP
jgi:hypothetical protein